MNCGPLEGKGEKWNTVIISMKADMLLRNALVGILCMTIPF